MTHTSRMVSMLVGAAGLLLALGVQAGQKTTSTVLISSFPGNTTASGTVGDARASSDGRQMIECAVESWSDPFDRALCTAIDRTGRTLTCMTTRPEQIRQVQSIGPNSYIFFQVLSGTEDCRLLTVTNGSRNRPVTP